MAFIEDFTPFFNAAEFADVAALTPAAGGLASAGTVIYDENGESLADLGIETVGPSCIFPIAQWPDVKEADTLEIAFNAPIGVRNYRVRSRALLSDGKICLLTLVRI